MIAALKNAWQFLWTEHGTKFLGAVQTSVSTLATQGLVSMKALAWTTTAIGLLTIWRGYINTHAANAPTVQPP